MPALGRFVFKGKSGKSYRFKVYPLGTRFRKISGVYVIASRLPGTNGGHRLVALYVGHTEDFSQPFSQHHKAQQFTERGATCVCLQSDDVEESRLAKERDLIAGLHPACND
jgi:hypothetical protein